MGIVKRKSLAAAEKARLHERMSISIEEKEQDAKEHYQQNKEAIRASRYKGAIPTESVDVCGSPSGDLSTLTSLKPLSLKPASIFSSGKIVYVLYVPLSFWSHQTHFPLCPLFGGSTHPRKLVQQNIVMSHKRNPAAEEELSLTIAHYLAAHSLPFSHAEDPLFNRILQKARLTNHKYEPPKRSQVAGKLLDAHFASYQKNGLESLLADVDTYGLAIFGDGATIVKTPLMNILASSPNNPSCVLDVIDCSKHMQQGGRKDAWFIAKNILPLMKKIDPMKDRINVVAFDGAANVQKAAGLLKEHFPAITVMQGVEHTIATIIGKWTGLRPIKDLCQFSKKVCTIL